MIRKYQIKKDRPFVCYFYFTGWWDISLGFHISLEMKNIEIHLPFGFIRIGYESMYDYYTQDELFEAVK